MCSINKYLLIPIYQTLFLGIANTAENKESRVRSLKGITILVRRECFTVVGIIMKNRSKSKAIEGISKSLEAEKGCGSPKSGDKEW